MTSPKKMLLFCRLVCMYYKTPKNATFLDPSINKVTLWYSDKGGDFYQSREWSPRSLRSLVDHKKIGFRSLGAPRLGWHCACRYLISSCWGENLPLQVVRASTIIRYTRVCRKSEFTLHVVVTLQYILNSQYYNASLWGVICISYLGIFMIIIRYW